MIERIEIQYFRSIYRMKIHNIVDLNVIAGLNDVGKSNILKALNLFFNNCIVKEGDFVFKENYNIKRLEEVRKNTIKGKQYIQIKITFRRGSQFEKTLPEVFTVTKKWNRDSIVPQISDDLETRLKRLGRDCNANSRRSLTRYLNKIRYMYVPAIKDQIIFDSLFKNLQDTVYTRKLSDQVDFQEMMGRLHEQVQKTTEQLSNEFRLATGIETSISTPREADELYKTLRIDTSYSGSAVPLENRGDGIRVRYLPSILNYIAINSNGIMIWGFEEPENSLEFNLACQMANDFYTIYSKNCQIFLTTHSPAFIDLGVKDRCSGFRCFKDDNETKVVLFDDAPAFEGLSEELGYAKILQKQYDEYQQILENNKNNKEIIESLQKSIADNQLPVLLTEGKTDAIIIQEAWARIKKISMPFRVESCDLMGDPSASGEIAGAGILKTILCGIRYDSGRLIIGLFDNDNKGRKEYNSLTNYIDNAEKNWQVHKTGKGIALTLPYDDDLKSIALDAENLTIELYFDKQYLINEINPEQSLLETPKIESKINGKRIETELAGPEYWYYGKVRKNKKTKFAKDTVPSLPDDAFQKFFLLFDKLEEILELYG